MNAGSEEMGALYTASISDQRQSEQGFCEPSRTAQEHLTNSFVEFVRCNSDTQPVISHFEEAAIAPLGVASPQLVEGVSENDIDLPVAIDCTLLTLVDAVQSNPTSLFENQNCAVEVKDCHEGTCSAASVAENEKSLNSAIANQTQGQVEQGNSASLRDATRTLLVENSVSGGEIKAVHEGSFSTAPVTNAEKWSHEAIVARSNMRPERMQKLKVVANSGQNPGFEYLRECWDDPALQIVIKKLLAKFPQWGIACLDGVLVDWGK